MNSTRADKVDGTPCYAVRLEKLYTTMHDSLSRRETLPPWKICGMALVELQSKHANGENIPWFRISVAGSLPQPSAVRKDSLFRNQFRALIKWLVAHDIPVHIPVETYAKARFYRGLVGDLVTVRESAQTESRFVKATGAVSVFVGEDIPRKERVGKARQVAADRREATGRKCIVCPAITHSWAVRYDGMPKNNKAKCGSCVACELPMVDIVYPKH